MLLGPRRTPKLDDHLLSTFRDSLFNTFAGTSHIGGRSSIRNLRTHHVFVTRTHLSWFHPKLMNILTYPWENSRAPARPSPAPSYATAFLDLHSPGEVMARNPLTHGTGRCATATMKHVDFSVTRFGDLNLCTVWRNTVDISSECRHLSYCFRKMVPQRTQSVNQLTAWVFSLFGEIAWRKRSPNIA